MNSSSSSASALENTHSGATFAPDSEGSNYFWPVWRFGRVLQPNGADSLAATVAQQIGSLFESGSLAAMRYLTERTRELRAQASRVEGTYIRDWPEHLRHASEASAELAEIWNPEEILVSYSFVPIIRLPRFVVEIAGSTWQIRESLTICGSPAKSKAWVTATLVAFCNRPTDIAPLSKSDLDAARAAFEPFVQGALASLVSYYLKVLNEDTKTLALEKPLHIYELAPLAETEIVSLSSGVDLGDALNLLEEKGFQRFCSEAAQGLFPGAREVLDFLEWTDSVKAPEGVAWRAGRPKILAIYAEEPACGALRALVIPRINADQNRTWYAAITEQRTAEKQPTRAPLSESAGRFLAREYGRYF